MKTKERPILFSPPPDIATLRRWARDNQIDPAPLKVGRTWYVERDAQYRPADRSERVANILKAA